MISQMKYIGCHVRDLLPDRYEAFRSGRFEGVESTNLLVAKCAFSQTKGLAEDIEDAYRQLQELLVSKEKSHLWRCWNKIPNINQSEAGIERYQLFCTGRHRALLGTNSVSIDRLPAATAVGVEEQEISLAFIASNAQGISIENPQQVSAFHYPKQYGKDSPSFSRAYLANNILFVSGTASIRGHQSLHENDLSAQLSESLQRIIELTQKRTVNSAMAYVRNADDMKAVRAALHQAYPDAYEIYCEKADICRKELLVEIEVTAQ